jgi:hypothetical protein
MTALFSFLYADPTPKALQVFLPRPGVKQTEMPGFPAEEGVEEGIWISADPIEGCVVCNIGESKCFTSSGIVVHDQRVDSVGDLDEWIISVHFASRSPQGVELSVRSS